MRIILLISIAVSAFAAQDSYTGPKPPKIDLPYLLHADSLVETESGMAKEQTTKDGVLYVIAGANSPVKTPMSSPILIIDVSKMEANRLQLYRVESKSGHREIAFKKKGKGNPVPVRLTVTQVQGSLWKLEAAESLPNGEYSLTIDGANDVFSFAVY